MKEERPKRYSAIHVPFAVTLRKTNQNLNDINKQFTKLTKKSIFVKYAQKPLQQIIVLKTTQNLYTYKSIHTNAKSAVKDLAGLVA